MSLSTDLVSLKKTPLYNCHVALGGKMVDFSGWALPVYYSGIIQEHQWTRNSCGVFDVSHLGEIRVHGKGAFDFLQYRLTNDMKRLSDGKIIYSILCDEKGHAIDDILIYQNTLDDYYLIVNASNIENDYEALKRYCPDSVQMDNQSQNMACIAVQGPLAEKVLTDLFKFDVASMPYYTFKQETFSGQPVWISRSGYTGEDGFEIFCANEYAKPVWDKLIVEGKDRGVLPCGLGARNTLRLEAGNVLYGHELDLSTTPFEAGLNFAISFDKGGFVGRDMMMRQKENGLSRKLVAFKMLDKPVARDGYPIYSGDQCIGKVTSGSFGPSAGCNIGMAYVSLPNSTVGSQFEVEIHGRRIPAEVVKRPFIELKHKQKIKA